MQAYYRAIPSQNHIITERLYKRKEEQHKKKLKAIKCSVDNQPPRHWKTKPRRNLKKEQLDHERFVKIERDNRLLLEKMANIMHNPKARGEPIGALPTAEGAFTRCAPKSLNVEFRQKEMKRIAKQNMLILQRIQACEPYYRVEEWEKDRQKHEKILLHMVFYQPKPDKNAKGKKGTKSKRKKRRPVTAAPARRASRTEDTLLEQKQSDLESLNARPASAQVADPSASEPASLT